MSWVAQVFSLAGFGFMVPFLPYHLQLLGVTDPQELNLWLGWMNAVAGFLLAAAAPFWGWLSDRAGRKLLLLRAMAAATLVVLGMAFVRTPMAILILRACQGLFSGTVASAVALVAAGTPRSRLSYALGVLSSSTFVGLTVGPLIGGLTAEVLGYRATFLVGGGVLAVGFLVVLLFAREVRSPARAATAAGRSWTRLVTPSVLALLVMVFLFRFARFMPIPFLPLLLQRLHGGLDGAAAITGAVTGAAGLASATAGMTLSRLGDRHDRFTLMGISVALGALVAVPLVFINSTLGFAVLFVVFSFCIGIFDPLSQATILKGVGPEDRGLMMGIVTLTGGLGWGVAPLAGTVLAAGHQPGSVFIGPAVALAVLAGLCFVMRVVSRRRLTDPG